MVLFTREQDYFSTYPLLSDSWNCGYSKAVDCYSDQVSKPHQHPFDEYTIVILGQYTAIIDKEKLY